MAVIAVADVLRHAEDFEGMLERYYRDVAEHTTRDGVRMLADYMQRHCRRLEEALARLSSEEYRRICAFPIRYEPQAADCRCFEGRELPPDATAADVLDMAVRFDECLILLYRQVLQQEIDEEVRELFESLVHFEEGDEIELKKIKAMDYF